MGIMKSTQKKRYEQLQPIQDFFFLKPHPNKHIIRIILQNYHDKKLSPSKKNNSFHLPSLENPIYNELSCISSVLFNMASSIAAIRSTENFIAIVFTNAHNI